MELMVAMAITSIIVTVLVSVTSVAIDTWNRSRSEIRAARQAKAMIDAMSKDFESLVTRRGNSNEWLSAVSDTAANLPGGSNLKSSNAAQLMFFSAATDRYNGKIGVAGSDYGGDVSCVAYQLYYKNAVNPATAGFETFILRRLVVDPDDAFRDMLGKASLLPTLATTPTAPAGGVKPSPKDKKYSDQLADATNFICENIYQFSLTFNVVIDGVPNPVQYTVGPSNTGQTTNRFNILGSGLSSNNLGSLTAAQLAAGKLTSVQVTVSVLSDFGLEQSKRRTFADDAAKAVFLAKNSYQYAKLVQLPAM